MTDLCRELHLLFHQLPMFGSPFEAECIPRNGIYVLFEAGEYAHGTQRIVRVGTHTGEGQLRSRLLEHFVRENKDRSIFRKNIGRALLHREGDPFLEQWELDLTTRENKERYGPSIDWAKQKAVEHQVTGYMQMAFRFVVFRVDDKGQRLRRESKIISTVSRCDECRPSGKWLGLDSPVPRIRESGLWMVQDLYKEPLSEQAFAELRQAVLGSSGGDSSGSWR